MAVDSFTQGGRVDLRRFLNLHSKQGDITIDSTAVAFRHPSTLKKAVRFPGHAPEKLLFCAVLGACS